MNRPLIFGILIVSSSALADEWTDNRTTAQKADDDRITKQSEAEEAKAEAEKAKANRATLREQLSAARAELKKFSPECKDERQAYDDTRDDSVS